MTAPRQIIKGATYKITRRCSERRCFLVPRPWVRQLFLYLLAVLAPKHGVILHTACVMSNHWHPALTDVLGTLPSFMAEFHRLSAGYTNFKLDRREAMWAQGSYQAQQLFTLQDIIDDCAYIITNPVAAGLVEDCGQWPGLVITPDMIGKPIRVTRPEGYFRTDGSMPEYAEITFQPPVGMDLELFRTVLTQKVIERTAQLHERLKAQGRGFLAPEVCLKWEVGAPAQSPEPFGQLSPRFKSRFEEVRRLAAAQLVAFRRKYRNAWNQWRKGLRDVVFPFGTYWMRLYAGVRCEPPD